MPTLTQLTIGALVGTTLALPAAAQEADGPARAHQVVADVTAVGVPVVSPDGRWIAVRESMDRVVVFSPSTPNSERQSFLCTPPDSKNAWVWTQAAAPAAFAEDSGAVVVTGPEGITYMSVGAKIAIQQNEAPAGTRLATTAARAGAWPMMWREGSSWFLRLWTPTGWRGEAIAIANATDTVRWINNPVALAATAATGDLIVIDPATGSVTTVATTDEAKAAIPGIDEKPIRVVRLLARGSGGRLLLEAEREAKRAMRVKMGRGMSRQLTADEMPKRGRNPGSAEPPPSLPRYRLLKEDGRVKRVSCISKARWLDTWIEAPSADCRSFLRLQVANDGGAGRGTPAIWTHLRMWPGEFEEHELGTAGLPGDIQAPRFEWLSTAADGESGLVFMRGLREHTFDVNDPAVLRKYAPGLPPGEQGKRMAIVFLMQHFERGGASGNTLSFAHQGVYRVSARGTLTPLADGFGEQIAPFSDHTGLPGVIGTPVWCAATRTLVASLHSPRDKAKSRGLVLIPVPK